MVIKFAKFFAPHNGWLAPGLRVGAVATAEAGNQDEVFTPCLRVYVTTILMQSKQLQRPTSMQDSIMQTRCFE